MTEVVISAANLALGMSRSENWVKAADAIGEATKRGTDVLVLPEMCVQGYPDFSFGEGSPLRERQMRYYAEEAESLPGPTTEALSVLLAKSEMIVQIGIAEAPPGEGERYNSVAIVSRVGLLGKYRKAHSRWEWPYFSAGSNLSVTETRIGKLGSLICSDLDFPEAGRVLALLGAELILVSTAWPVHERSTRALPPTPHLEFCARSAAFHNQVWVAVSDHCESGIHAGKVDYCGGTMLIDPLGEVVVAATRTDELITTQVDLHASVLEARSRGFFEMDLLAERRPELYGLLVSSSDAGS